MLTYAFQSLKQSHYEEVAGEAFEEIQDLFAAILAKGIAQQLKQGLYREYVSKQEVRPVLRGRLDMVGTIGQELQRKKRLSCSFDELSENNIYNQILKTTATLLIQHPSVSAVYRKALRKTMIYFGEVDTLPPRSIRWDALHFGRAQQNYELLLNVCYFVLDGMLQTTEQGAYRMAAFSDEHMNLLYQRFLLAYYEKHKRELGLRKVAAEAIKWDLDADKPQVGTAFLPKMYTDIVLKKGEKTLIIDAKYYGKTLQTHYQKQTIHSGNLYQIYTYVKNYDNTGSGSAAGVLLYAKTQESIVPDAKYHIGGNCIRALTVDLNREFSEIAYQLNSLVAEFFD